jgi:hypothetical protein
MPYTPRPGDDNSDDNPRDDDALGSAFRAMLLVGKYIVLIALVTFLIAAAIDVVPKVLRFFQPEAAPVSGTVYLEVDARNLAREIAALREQVSRLAEQCVKTPPQ